MFARQASRSDDFEDLPLSVLAQSVMQDVDFAAIDAVDDRPAEGELRVTWDGRANQPVSFIRAAEQIEREQRLVRAALNRAKSMEVRPDADPSAPTQYDELVPQRIDDLTNDRSGRVTPTRSSSASASPASRRVRASCPGERGASRELVP